MLEVESDNKTRVYKKNEKDETRGIKGCDMSLKSQEWKRLKAFDISSITPAHKRKKKIGCLEGRLSGD